MDTYTTQSLDWYGLPDGFGRRAVGSVDTARNAFVQVICTCAGSTCDDSSAVVARTTNRDCRQISARYAIRLTRFGLLWLGKVCFFYRTALAWNRRFVRPSAQTCAFACAFSKRAKLRDSAGMKMEAV